MKKHIIYPKIKFVSLKNQSRSTFGRSVFLEHENRIERKITKKERKTHLICRVFNVSNQFFNLRAYFLQIGSFQILL